MRKSNAVLLCCTATLILGCCGFGNSKKDNEAEARRAEHIAKLKSHVSPDVLSTIDPEFYTYPGVWDFWRFPLVYPYSIHCIDSFDSGTLCQHDGKTRISNGNADSIIQDVGRLVEFNFDARYLIGRKKNDPSNKESWILFDFKTGKTSAFQTEEELAAAAKSAGYTGEMNMANMESQYKHCFP